MEKPYGVTQQPLGYLMPSQIILTLPYKVTIVWECESPTVGRFEL